MRSLSVRDRGRAGRAFQELDGQPDGVRWSESILRNVVRSPSYHAFYLLFSEWAIYLGVVYRAGMIEGGTGICMPMPVRSAIDNTQVLVLAAAQ